MKVLDFRARPRTPYYYRHIVPKPIPAYEAYFSIYHMSDRMKLAPLEESVEEMQSAGITNATIFSGDAEGFEDVYKDVKKYPDFFIPMTDIDLSQGVTKAAYDLEKAYKEYNFRGLTLSPFVSGIYASDPRCYPLYALSEKMGRPVQIHASTHFNPLTPLDMGDPMHIDRIAVHFPELNFILGHAGMGFGSLGITVAQRRPNVYIDFTGLRPKYLGPEFVHAVNTILARKSIFGTNYPSLAYDSWAEWKDVVRPEAQPYFFHKNAAKLLGLQD